MQHLDNIKENYAFICISFLLHLLFLFTILFISFYWPTKPVIISNSDSSHFISSFIYEVKNPNLQKIKLNSERATNFNDSHHTIALSANTNQSKVITKKHQPHTTMLRHDEQPKVMTNTNLSHTLISVDVDQPHTKMLRQANESSKQNKKSLVSLLHDAIQAKQHYPEIALQMARQGRVTLQFRLLVSGEMSNLHILQSSGTDALDQAALEAAQAAAPFKQVNQYLDHIEEFNVDVVFE